jgi:hypothetical protein
MKHRIFTLVMIIIPISFCYSQYTSPDLQRIYESFGTPFYRDVQTTWKITDPNLIREILHQLDINGYLIRENKDEARGSEGLLNSLVRKVDESQIDIFCREKYLNDNLEIIEISTDGGLRLEPLTDPAEMRKALSDTTYNKIIKKDYAYINLTKQDYYSNRSGYITLDILHSEFVLGSIENPSDNSEIFSLFYRLDYDNINLPSWYKGSIVAGIKYRLVPVKEPNIFNYEKFSLALGWESPLDFSSSNDFIPDFMRNMFRDKLLISTTDNIFIGASYAFPDIDGEFLQLNAEVAFPIYKRSKESLPLSNIENFYSVKNHWSVGGRVCNMENLFNIGGSFSGFWLYQYSNIASEALVTLKAKHHYLISLEPAITNENMPIYYSISPQLNLDLVNGQKFFVFKSQLMLFRSFGIDFKYFKSLNGNKTVPWHYNDYVVISPVIRINFD